MACTSASVIFIDGSESQYLQQRTDAPELQLGRESLSSIMSALTGFLPPYNADQATISELVTPSPLRKPRAFVALSVAGLTKEDVTAAFSGRHMEETKIDGCPQEVQSAAVSAVAQANPDVHVISIDQQALQGCENNCIEEHLASAASTFDGEHAIGESPALVFSSGKQLLLSQIANKLFAIELASVWGGIKEQVKKQQEIRSSGHAQEQDIQQDVQVYEIVLLGLQALATTHEEGCEEMQAAQNAVRHMLARAVKQIDEAFDGDVVYQVVICDEGVAQVQAGKSFTTKACAYGGFILLLYFSMAAVWCMCNMPMQVDTLLFGSKKAE
eukprot:gene20259-27013_t